MGRSKTQKRNRNRNRGNQTQPDIPALPLGNPAACAFYRQLLKFQLDDRCDHISLGCDVSSFKRRLLHELCDTFGFNHCGAGPGSARYVLIWKQHTRKPASQQEVRRPDPEQLPQPSEESLREMIQKFAADTRIVSFNFPPTLNHTSRRIIHTICDEIGGLDHDSFGRRGIDRYLRITKVDANTLRMREQRRNGLNVAYASYLERVRQARARDESEAVLERAVLAKCKTEPKSAQSLRFVQFNIEWMDYFFASDSSFKEANANADITDVHELCTKVAQCIDVLGADVIAIEEGPSSIARMRLFVKRYLHDAYEVFGGLENVTQQLYLLISKKSGIEHATVFEPALAFLSKSWYFDVDGDLSLQEYKFTRRPLVVQAMLGQTPLFMGVVHLKSKFVSRGRFMWQSERPDLVQKFVAKAVKNRRRIAAECQRMRECIVETMLNTTQEPWVIIAGDCNDGPGTDFFESHFGIFNSIDALLGSPFYGTSTLSSICASIPSQYRFSCEFDDYVDNVPNKRVMLDHIFVSTHAKKALTYAAVCHSEFQSVMTNNGVNRQDRASDHRPVCADFTLS